ncbi:hypothetical protein, partial [Escherichia coli]|uniref:hypothetical protein n=1 Tax=Escherichia coli TaxID=562 RepID=UPI00390C60F0
LALDVPVLSGAALHPVQSRPQAREENLVDQGALPGPGHAGDAVEGPQGDGRVNIPQVVFRRATDGQRLSAAPAPLRRDGD